MNYQMGESVIYVIYSAKRIADAYGLPLVVRELVFVILFVMSNTPMHSYFISKGVKEEEIKRRANELLNSLAGGKDYMAGSISFKRDGREEEAITVDREVINLIFEAGKIAQKDYATNKIEASHLTGAFSKLYPNVYEIIKM